MKKSIIALAAFATVFSFSCSKENRFAEETSPKSGIILTVTAEQNTTKGAYTDAGQFNWAEGDIIGVDMWDSSHNWPAQLTLKEGADTPVGKFGTDDTNTYGNVAFYPWNGWNDISEAENGTNMGGDGHFYVHLKPEIAYYNSSNKPQQLLPLAAQIAQGQTEDIMFKQLAAGIKVSIKNVPAQANKASLTIPGKNITGWFSIDDITSIGTASLASTNGSNSTVSISFPKASAAQDMDFVFPVPTGEIPGMEVALYSDNVLIWKKTAPAQPTLSKGQILTNAPLTVDGPYYLFGYINGGNYACEENAGSLGDYRFVNGKLYFISNSDSYVAIKDANGNYYMTEGYPGNDATVAELKPTSMLTSPDKMKIPANTAVELTMSKSGDVITLSYTVVDKVTLYFTLDSSIDFTDLKLCCEAIGTAGWPGTSLDLSNTETIMLKTYYKYVTTPSNVWGKTPNMHLYGVSSPNWASQASAADFTSKKTEYYFDLGSNKYGTITQLSGRPTPPKPVAISVDGKTGDWDKLSIKWTSGNNDRVKAWKATYDDNNIYIYMEIDEDWAKVNGKWGSYVEVAFDLDNKATTPTGVNTDYGFGLGWEATAVVFPFTNSASASEATLANGVNDSELYVPFKTLADTVTSMGNINGGVVYLEFAISRTTIGAPASGPILVKVGGGSHLLDGQYLFL